MNRMDAFGVRGDSMRALSITNDVLGVRGDPPRSASSWTVNWNTGAARGHRQSYKHAHSNYHTYAPVARRIERLCGGLTLAGGGGVSDVVGASGRAGDGTSRAGRRNCLSELEDDDWSTSCLSLRSTMGIDVGTLTKR